MDPPNSVTSVKGRDKQQKRTRTLTKNILHIYSTLTNIKVISWVTKHK